MTTPRIDDDAMVDDEDGEGVVEAIETLASRDVDADGVARGAWNAREVTRSGMPTQTAHVMPANPSSEA